MKSLEFERLKPLAMPAYAVAALLMLIPVVDTVPALWPPRLHDVTWRFGALGLGSQMLMTPLLGGLLALTTAAVLEHRGAIRFLRVLASLTAVVLVASIALFLLDAVQMRASIRPGAKALVDKAALTALAKYLLAVAASVLFVIASHRLAKRDRADAAAAATKASPRFVDPSPARG